MRATLITLIGPRIDPKIESDLLTSLPRVLAMEKTAQSALQSDDAAGEHGDAAGRRADATVERADAAAEHEDAAVEITPRLPIHAAQLSDLDIRQWQVNIPPARVRTQLQELLAPVRAAGLDLLITPAALLDAGPRLIVTDVDSTLIRDEVIELLADHAGSGRAVAQVTEAAMRGELDFKESLAQRVATLRGLPVSVFEQVHASVRLTAGVENLCRVLKRNSDYIGVVSGGFIEIVQPLADALSIDFTRANRLATTDGYLSGGVDGTVVDREVKAQTLREWARQTGVPIERTIAVGDGANDLDMLAAAGLGVAFNAKPVVQAAADTAITSSRLDALLAVIG